MVDFTNNTSSVTVNRSSDQDVVELCKTIEIFKDELVERTEHFSVFLQAPPTGADLASCRVAIIDANGGKLTHHEDKNKENHVTT